MYSFFEVLLVHQPEFGFLGHEENRESVAKRSALGSGNLELQINADKREDPQSQNYRRRTSDRVIGAKGFLIARRKLGWKPSVQEPAKTE